MKTNLTIKALAAILGLALAGAPVITKAETTPAATTTAAPTATTPVKPDKVKKAPTANIEYKGTLTAIDTKANTITVETTSKKDGTKSLVLAIAATTSYKKDGKSATLADFAVGETVTGSYLKGATGTLTAASVHTKAATATAAKAAAATPAAAAPAASTPAAK